MNRKTGRPLRVAWFTYFPIEWLPDLPPELHGVRKDHPATWQRVLCEEFQKRADLELHVISLRNSFPNIRFRQKNVTFHCIKTPPATRSTTLYWLDTFLVRRVLKEIQPDLVHAWGTEYGSAAVAGRLGYPALVTMQGLLNWLSTAFELSHNQKLSRLLESSSLRKAHVVSCESSFAMKYLAEHYPHLKLLQIEHAPNQIFSSINRDPPQGRIRFVCIGGFSAPKGADIVVRALEKLRLEREWEMVWIGGRDVEFERGLNVGDDVWKRVSFRHGLTSNEIAEEFAQATLMIHASRADNSPNAVKEAVVAGVPVVATRTGGIPDYVFPERNGFLFESGNVDDCSAMIRQALAHPLFSVGKVDTVTLERVREYLSAETMAAKFAEAYEMTLRVDPRSKVPA